MFHTLGALKNMAGPGAPEPELRIANEKRLMQTCQGIVSATPRERDNLVRFYGAVREKIQVVPGGVNLRRFRPIDRRAARRQLGFDEDESIVLYVGRFVLEKGLDRLIEALTHLRGYPRLRLVVVGGDGADSAAYQDLQRLVHQVDVAKHVTFAGRIEQSDLPPYYSAADVLVIPSRYESFGLAGLESLACGTPVVSTPVGAVDDILGKDLSGVAISGETPGELARSIEVFLSGSSAGATDPEVVRASVLEFNWSTVAAAMIDQYARLLENQA
jgi:D-inositol-3-phosphate glycosyltransferase